MPLLQLSPVDEQLCQIEVDEEVLGVFTSDDAFHVLNGVLGNRERASFLSYRVCYYADIFTIEVATYMSHKTAK